MPDFPGFIFLCHECISKAVISNEPIIALCHKSTEEPVVCEKEMCIWCGEEGVCVVVDEKVSVVLRQYRSTGYE